MRSRMKCPILITAHTRRYIMCLGGSPSAPPPAPATPPPVNTDVAMEQGADNERKRRAAAAGSASTILTSPTGASGQAQTTSKTLMGA